MFPAIPRAGSKAARPPGAFQQVFVNDPAFWALSQKRFSLPEGASIAKENYDAGGRLHNLAVVR